MCCLRAQKIGQYLHRCALALKASGDGLIERAGHPLEPKSALMRELGADQFIDYTRTAADEIVRDVDVVLDAVGGPDTGRFFRTLKRGGSLYPVYPLGFTGHAEAETLGITVSTTQVRSSGAQLAEAARLLDDGTIRIVVDSIFPLADAARAHERAARGNIQGKIVLSVA